MNEKLEEEAYLLSMIHRRVTPPLLMRKFKITFDCAEKICQKVWLRLYKEARELASNLEFNGWLPQLDKCRKKNLKKFKKK